MINEEQLKADVNESVTRHIEGLNKIFSYKDVANISDEYQLNGIGMINALINKMITQLDLGTDTISEDIVKDVTCYIESYCKNYEYHPTVSCVMLLKLISDILIQIAIADKYIEGDAENEK